MVAGNGLGTELVSGYGLRSALSQDLHGCFVWVFTMADFIILDTMGIGRDGTQLGFRDICLIKLMVCEVPEAGGVTLALENLYCFFGS